MTLPLNDEIAALERNLKDTEEAIGNTRRLLRPYWNERTALENRIAKTLPHKVETYIPWEGAEERETVHVTGYHRAGAEVRLPLYSRIDQLRYNYAEIHKELAALKMNRAHLKTLQKHLEKLASQSQPPLFR